MNIKYKQLKDLVECLTDELYLWEPVEGYAIMRKEDFNFYWVRFDGKVGDLGYLYNVIADMDNDAQEYEELVCW